MTEPEVAEDVDSSASEHTDRPQPLREIGNVIYVWQMQVANGWNIIGMQMPSGQTMPLVTTSLPLAWEAFEIAQAHANVNACQVRLAMFTFDTLAAVVDPNEQ